MLEAGKRTVPYDSGRRLLTEVRNDVTGSGSTYPLIEYTYNNLGQKTQVKAYAANASNKARTTTYTYDQLGRLKKMVLPDDGGTRLLYDEYYQFDLNNNLIAKLVGIVDGSGNITAGNVTAYEYDTLNRVTKVKYGYAASTWPIGAITISTPDISYAYTAGSDLKSTVIAGSAHWSYTYDARGRLSTYSPALPGNCSAVYAFNADNRKTSITVMDSNSNSKYRTSYSYFKNGWLKQVTGEEYVSGNWVTRAQVDYDRYTSGNTKTRKNNGTSDVQTAYTYDARNNPMGIVHSDASTLYALDYYRDPTGYPLQIVFSGSAFPSPYTGVNKVRFSYNENGRLLTQDWGYGDWTSANSTTWGYDWVGNRNPSLNTYNQADMLNKDNGYKYDYLGNLEYDPNDTDSTRTRYHYNAANLLCQVDDVTSGATVSTVITWDPDFQRARLERGSDSWNYLYDATAQEPGPLLEQATTNSTRYGDILCPRFIR